MARIPGVRRLLRLPAGALRVRSEIDEEISFHLGERVAELLARGLPPAEARERALREFGDVEGAREELARIDRRRVRRERRIDGWGALRQDVRYGLRTLARSRGFAAVSVLTLGLGVGANSAIFSVVKPVLLDPLPFPGMDRLMVVWETSREHDFMVVAPPNYRDWAERNRAFESLAGFDAQDVFLVAEEETVDLRASRITSTLLPTLGVRPLLGRNFLPEEEGPAGEPVVLLGHSLWRTRFGGDPGILGRTIELASGPHTVVGVMPPDFDFPPVFDSDGNTYRRENQLWLPYRLDLASPGMRGAHFMTVVGRLRPGVTPEDAEAEMASVAASLAREHPDTNAEWGVRLEPLRDAFVGEVGGALRVLLLAVGMVLLIACVNVANLLLARATQREHEYAVRASLGASRARLVVQALVETQLLALAGGAAGLLLGYGGIALLVRLAPRDVPGLENARIDLTVVGFTFAVALLAGLAFGLVPALRSFLPDLAPRLRGGARSGASEERSRLRSGLVVAQVALSLLLLVGAGLLFRSFLALRAVETGVRAERVLTARTSLPQARFPERPQVARAYEELEARLRAVPGVEAAGFSLDVPLAGDFQGTGLEIVGAPPPAPDEVRAVNFSVVTPGYFAAMGIPVVSGRAFTGRDGPEGAPAVIVNETLARRFFPGRDPLGRRIEFGEERTIVGVVGDVRIEDLRADPPPIMYFPHAQQAGYRGLALVARTRGDPAEVIGSVRAAIRELDPAIPLFEVRTMETILSESVSQPRFWAMLLLAFSSLALLLAAVGIYGVISYSVGRRTREIGIRLAIGASPRGTVGMIVGEGLRLLLAGVALGAAAAFFATRYLEGLLFGVEAMDPLVLLGTAAFLVLVGVAAAYGPALRASRIEPMAALRAE